MPPSPILGANWRTSARAVHPADLPTAFCRGFGLIARCLGLGCASGRVVLLVHGVEAFVRDHPSSQHQTVRGVADHALRQIFVRVDLGRIERRQFIVVGWGAASALCRSLAFRHR